MKQPDALLKVETLLKVNLSLHVVGKRADGYHLLDSLVAFCPEGDRLFFYEASAFSLDVTGPFAYQLAGNALEDNIIYKACMLFKENYRLPHHFHVILEKNIPVGAGLGGGSGDAAFTLNALKKLGKIAATKEEICKIGLSLGADVPICLHGKASFMRGIGEQITPLSFFPEMAIVLINPMIHVATPSVFKKVKPPYKNESKPLPSFLKSKNRYSASYSTQIMISTNMQRNYFLLFLSC